MKSQSDKFFYLLAGSFAGAVVALLFAPQSGSKTRKQVRKYSREAGNRAQEFVGALAETLDEALMDVLEAGGDSLKKGKKLTGRARHEVMEMLDAGKKYLEEETEKVSKILK